MAMAIEGRGRPTSRKGTGTPSQGASTKKAQDGTGSWPAEMAGGLFGRHPIITDAVEVRDRELLFCGKSLSTVPLNRDCEDVSFGSVPISSLSFYKARLAEDLPTVWKALEFLNVPSDGLFHTIREAICQILRLPFSAFLGVFCRVCGKKPRPFMGNGQSFLSGRFTLGFIAENPEALS